MNEENQNVPAKAPKLEGKYIFAGIQEGEGVGKRTLIFNPPLVIEYDIYEKNNPDGTMNFTDDVKTLGYATFDFGLEVEIALDPEHNFLTKGAYEGLTNESDVIDVLMYSLFFDLFHAFCHTSLDPNYTHYHWALYGWLKDRGTVIDVTEA